MGIPTLPEAGRQLDTLRTVSQTTKFVIISALSNPIARLNYCEDDLTFRTDLGSLYEDIMDCLSQTLNCNPDLQVWARLITFSEQFYIIILCLKEEEKIVPCLTRLAASHWKDLALIVLLKAVPVINSI